MGAFYRLLPPLLLCATAVLTAPQDAANSDITYVKIEPILDETRLEKIDSDRQSRIEKLPLTIPGNITQQDQSESTTNSKFKRNNNKSAENSRENSSQETSKKFQRKYTFKKSKTPEVLNKTESTRRESVINISESKNNISESITKPEETKFEVQPKIETESKVSDNSEDFAESKIISSEPEVDPTAIDFISDSIVADTNNVEKQFIETTTTNYETNDPIIPEVTTAKIETQSTPKITTQLEIQTKPTISKLGYFRKTSSTSINNLIQNNTGKRRFRSRCRCEKIWNCPKLQISVARCPDEYFLCCF